MKAISLWQPWASLIAVGAKRFETRSWATNYRGPLLICAAKGGLSKRNFLDFLEDLKEEHKIEFRNQALPFGEAVCLVDLVDCIRTENLIEDYRVDLPFGDFSYGRFAWKLENVRAFKEPFPIRGAQGLFEVDDALIIGREMKEPSE